MKILLDTSTPVCYLTIVSDGARAEYSWEAGRTLARGLLKFLDDKLRENGAENGVRNISGIGVMKGPGSFTGLRIGLSVANTLADGLNVPVVGESGEGWQDKALKRLESGENQQIVLPEYGASANITKAKK